MTDPNPEAAAPPPSASTRLAETIGAIVTLGAAAVSAERCVLAWTDAAGEERVVRAPEGGARWDAALSAAIAALDNRLIDTRGAPPRPFQKIELTARELASLARGHRRGEGGASLAAAAFVGGPATLRIAVAAPADRAREEVQASLELICRAALAEFASAGAALALDYWRAQSARAAGAASGARKKRAVELAADSTARQTRIATLEAEATARRALVSRLALRMFTAIDEERARIARDLHDDQAQLLAAARIALEGGPEQARAIFVQVERELRRRTRELRPVALGRATLAEAIEREFPRLEEAGVAARLIRGRDADGISRPVQQLCFQVAREAISNVIRHARAKSVEVRIERSDATARVSIADDGRGLSSAARSEGTGLAGARERLELMGGSLAIKSGARGTTIIAEIPEPETAERN